MNDNQVIEYLKKRLNEIPVRYKASNKKFDAEGATWVADKNARRVPNFVIEMTGCKTKKKIVEKYGELASFTKGKKPPKEMKS